MQSRSGSPPGASPSSGGNKTSPAESMVKSICIEQVLNRYDLSQDGYGHNPEHTHTHTLFLRLRDGMSSHPRCTIGLLRRAGSWGRWSGPARDTSARQKRRAIGEQHSPRSRGDVVPASAKCGSAKSTEKCPSGRAPREAVGSGQHPSGVPENSPYGRTEAAPAIRLQKRHSRTSRKELVQRFFAPLYNSLRNKKGIRQVRANCRATIPLRTSDTHKGAGTRTDGAKANATMRKGRRKKDSGATWTKRHHFPHPRKKPQTRETARTRDKKRPRRNKRTNAPRIRVVWAPERHTTQRQAHLPQRAQ